MPKAIKGTAGRKPPEPSGGHADIDAWFGRLVPKLQPIVEALDESIRTIVPGLHYAIKWKRAFYGLPQLGWISELAPYDVSVNVVFYGGADFDPPPPLGSTDRTRYVKVTSRDEVQRPELHAWIARAGRTPGARPGHAGAASASSSGTRSCSASNTVVAASRAARTGSWSCWMSGL